jgi:hypothetical protein
MVVKPVGNSLYPLGGLVNFLFDAVEFARVLGVFVGVDVVVGVGVGIVLQYSQEE